MTTTTTTQAHLTTQIYRVFIKATPEAIWDAITRPEWTEQYLYATRSEYDLTPGGAYVARPGDAMRAGAEQMGWPVPDVVADGEVIEADPPRRLVQTWKLQMAAELAAEPYTRLTWEIKPSDSGVTSLTVVHELDGAPGTAAMVAGADETGGAGGGWAMVLSSLKTLLETGAPLYD